MDIVTPGGGTVQVSDGGYRYVDPPAGGTDSAPSGGGGESTSGPVGNGGPTGCRVPAAEGGGGPCALDPPGPVVGCLDRGIPGACPTTAPTQPDPAVQLSATQLADINASRALAPPEIYVSPPPGSDSLVNLPVWLGVDNWTPQSVSASQGGLTVTVTATPSRVVWSMGRGDSVTCYGPGARYNVNVRDESQSTNCSYTYTRSSYGLPDERYSAQARLVYDVSWTSNNGESGSLGTGSATTEFAMRVAERQALTTFVG